MEISALASGSSGNCFYIENNANQKAILIDAGISAKQITERLRFLGKKPENIKGIFITHEHADHIRGSAVFSDIFKIPVFATKKTAKNSFLCKDNNLLNVIKNNEALKLANLEIEAFSKSHKAEDPVFFSVMGKKRVSVITDLGYCCKNTIQQVSESNAIFLESNHDVNMLKNGPYPYFLKKWVAGDDGHLSNLQASLCILEHGTRKLKNLVLSHLSRTNNTPEMALHMFNSLLKERKDLASKITISSREHPTSLIRI